MCLKGVGSTGWIGNTPPVHSREPYETWNGCRIDFLATQIKNPLKAGSNTKGKSDGGSRNGPKVEGLGCGGATRRIRNARHFKFTMLSIHHNGKPNRQVY